MSADSIPKELAEIADEVRTHAVYLAELGVESFQSSAPKRAPVPVIAPATEVQRSTPAKAGPRIIAKPLAVPSEAGRSQPKTGNLLSAIFPVTQEALPQSHESLEQIWAEVGPCRRCPLSEGRRNIVHTEGSRNARLMFVGEAPGADEDDQARPFVGRAGQLLTKIIEAIGFKREEVLIGNINRCRPPSNRAPLPDEVAACKPYLLREIASARPEVIVVLGNTAMKNLLDIKEGITRVRGNFQDYKGIKVMPTFHPAYLLRDPSKKRETWEDLKKVRAYLDAAKRS